ncbi:hypothetical protein [Halopelagius longus]|uniref:Uncharacterized protein n=1 Tax=Halopelagius longus TaxID=1236180 RepID=A0A370IQ33_9EURY|nr:hypothetical protein [Halopelagius longus]RDI72830.1 hypothetical protein DWB78_14450 [Halopelagius longus]
MVEFKRPDGGDVIGVLTILFIYAYHALVRGNPPTALETAFAVSILVLFTIGAFVEGFVRSWAYLFVGGGVIAAFSVVRYLRVDDAWAAVWVAVGLLAAGYGAFVARRDSDRETRG